MTTKLLLVFEMFMIVVCLLVMLAVAALFFLAGGFGSPMQFAFFAMGLLVTLTSIYLACDWASDNARDWRRL
jgi:hypothetical protein